MMINQLSPHELNDKSLFFHSFNPHLVGLTHHFHWDFPGISGFLYGHPRQQHPLPHPEDRFTDPAPDPHPLGKAKAEIVRPYWVWKPRTRRSLGWGFSIAMKVPQKWSVYKGKP